MSNAPKVRTIILTAGVTATAVTGAWYGAGLKTKQQVKQVRIIPRPTSLPPLRFHHPFFAAVLISS